MRGSTLSHSVVSQVHARTCIPMLWGTGRGSIVSDSVVSHVHARTCISHAMGDWAWQCCISFRGESGSCPYLHSHMLWGLCMDITEVIKCILVFYRDCHSCASHCIMEIFHKLHNYE